MAALSHDRPAACARPAMLWLALLLLLAAGPQLAAATLTRYCANGGSIEYGLCYRPCPLGWWGVGCTCWKGARAQWRGCGSLPASCRPTSFAPAQLPPSGARQPFTLALSADPQLFRWTSHPNDEAAAIRSNAALVDSINTMGGLQAWPQQVGGGAVAPPRSLMVLGDLTEYNKKQEMDGFRHFYDPSFPRNEGHRIKLPTWLMLGNHDYVNNVALEQLQGGCLSWSLDRNMCARRAVDMMRSAVSPACDAKHWTGFPKSNVTSFHVESMSYSFDYEAYHFVVLHHNPRFAAPEVGIYPSMAWLALELSSATAQGRKVVLLLHAHKELNLPSDPSFGALLAGSNVVAVFYGHIHVPPWGLVGRFPNTSVPIFNCGASWYRVFCAAEFSEAGFRVAVVRQSDDGSAPYWDSASRHAFPAAPQAPLKARVVASVDGLAPKSVSAKSGSAATGGSGSGSGSSGDAPKAGARRRRLRAAAGASMLWLRGRMGSSGDGELPGGSGGAGGGHGSEAGNGAAGRPAPVANGPQPAPGGPGGGDIQALHMFVGAIGAALGALMCVALLD